jgi:hypothetical protein
MSQFYAVEIDTYVPAVGGAAAAAAHGTRAHGTPADPSSAEVYGTIRASDTGYRGRSTDSGGMRVFPPLLASAFAIDRRVDLDPVGTGSAVAWGSVSLANPNGQWDSVVASQNSDGRAVRIYSGRKAFDPARGIWTDPAFADLALAFSGLATPWALTEITLDVPLRGAEYWLTQPLQSALYGGTGGLDGGADLTGLPKPKTRGGTSGNPVQNVPAVLVDPTNRIYQYSDGPGMVVAVAEGGDQTNIVFQTDVSDLYTGSTTPGHYRTNNARGLFQLGSTPVRTITADVTGAFPVAGTQTTLAAIVRYLLTEDTKLPAGNLDTTSFAAIDSAYPYLAGLYFGPAPVAGLDAAGAALAGAGMKMVPLRTGALSVLPMEPPGTHTPVATFTTANTVSVTPIPLPANVSPPPFRFRVGYAQNYNPNTTDVSPAVTSMDRKSFLAAQFRYAGWSSGAVLTQYRRPNDPAPLPGPLLVLADAQAVANRLGALWGVRRRLYSVVLPRDVAIAREFGDTVTLVHPLDDLRAGQPGVVVGEQIRSADATITLMVLV